jgi:hypothetical protein
MSHPIYLSSSSLPRMPEGSRNEWRNFFGDGAELEANAFFPLFWRALFDASDIRHARFIDEHDIDDEASAVDREECLADFGPDATFPYLVTDKAAGVARLAARREAVLDAVGERYRPIYESFEAFVSQHFADHILLRTRGLPDAADAEPWLRISLADLENLRDSETLASLMSDLARHDVDPVWTLAGSGNEDWPTPALRERFPDPRLRKTRIPARPGQAEEHVHEVARPRPHKARSWFDPALEWLGAVAAAGAALGVYAYTRSGWLAAVAFLCAALALGFGIVRLRGPRS